MSHFVRCDRCATEDSVMGTISLPPGWQKICGADLCELCCTMVHDFIRFKPSDAEKLPIEPIPVELKATQAGPIDDRLFETAPEVKPNAVSSANPVPMPSSPINKRGAVSDDQHGDIDNRRLRSGESSSESSAAIRSVAEEVSTEERARERKKRKLRAAVLPDPRKPTDPPPRVQP